jgi:hypothetical protein
MKFLHQTARLTLQPVRSQTSQTTHPLEILILKTTHNLIYGDRDFKACDIVES